MKEKYIYSWKKKTWEPKNRYRCNRKMREFGDTNDLSPKYPNNTHYVYNPGPTCNYSALDRRMGMCKLYQDGEL